MGPVVLIWNGPTTTPTTRGWAWLSAFGLGAPVVVLDRIRVADMVGGLYLQGDRNGGVR